MRVLFVAPLPVAAIALPPLILLGGFALASGRKRLSDFGLAVLTVAPSLVITGLSFLLIDNFTYIVLGFGVRTVPAVFNWPYLILLTGLSVCAWIFFWRLQKEAIGNSVRVFAYISASMALLSLSVGFWVTRPVVRPVAATTDGSRTGLATGHPNILLIGSDGLNANSMSLYGYERNTTPFLEEFAKEALVCENAYSNAGSSGASVASLLTGKLPTTTRVVYPPDVLRGLDAYQHLPGLLRNCGYRLVDISLRHYADAFDLNMRNSFDRSNSRDAPSTLITTPLEAYIDVGSAYFLELLWDRIAGRLKQIVGYSDMDDAFEQVAEAETKYLRDKARLEELRSFIEAGDEPFFAHLHLMGTHGPTFKPDRRRFSSGKEQNRRWMMDFYDDSIVDFDGVVKEIVGWLAERDLFEKTLVIIGSDHGQKYRTVVRIPLIFRFPRGQHAGRIPENAQNLDIGPTILDYIGLDTPEWMEGQSLISGELDAWRPIFGGRMLYSAQSRVEGLFQLDPSKMFAPFCSLGTLSMILCEHWYQLELHNKLLRVGRVVGHTSPCTAIPSTERAQEMLSEHLASRGYDLSSYAFPVRVLETDLE